MLGPIFSAIYCMRPFSCASLSSCIARLFTRAIPSSSSISFPGLLLLRLYDLTFSSNQPIRIKKPLLFMATLSLLSFVALAMLGCASRVSFLFRLLRRTPAGPQYSSSFPGAIRGSTCPASMAPIPQIGNPTLTTI